LQSKASHGHRAHTRPRGCRSASAARNRNVWKPALEIESFAQLSEALTRSTSQRRKTFAKFEWDDFIAPCRALEKNASSFLIRTAKCAEGYAPANGAPTRGDSARVAQPVTSRTRRRLRGEVTGTESCLPLKRQKKRLTHNSNDHLRTANRICPGAEVAMPGLNPTLCLRG